MTGPTRQLPAPHGGEPYSEEGQRLAPAPHQVNERALAMRSRLGKLLLTGESEFKVIARAARVPAESLVLELISVARKKPEILECTDDSIMTFMFDAAKLGLMIGRGVFPVPVNHGQGRDREKRLEAWVGYHGAKELAISSGAIRDCWATVHFEGDDFEIVEAPIPNVIRHKGGPHVGDMKFALGVYATLLYPGGRTRAKYFPRAKIEEYRTKNRGNTTSATSPWVSNTAEMWLAKAILHATSDLPRNPRLAHLQRLVERDEVPEGLDPADEVQPPAAAAPSPAPAPDPVEEAELADPPAPMALGVAESLPITMKGGAVRMLRELRSDVLERIREQARDRLEADPENADMRRIAEGCSVVIEARAAGITHEPPRAPQVDG
jgi:recombinational DNA repair protein RecT